MVIAFGFYLVRNGGIKLNSLNPITIHIYLYIVYLLFSQLILSFFYNSNLGAGLFSSLIVHDKNFIGINFLMLIDFLFFCLGIFVYSKFHVSKVRYINSLLPFDHFKSVNFKKFEAVNLIFASILVIDVLLFILFAQKFGLGLFDKNVDDVRYNALENGGIPYLFFIYMYTNPIIGNLLYLKIYSSKKSSNLTKILLFASLLLQISSLLTGFRTFLFVYVLIIGCSYSLINTVNKKQLLLVFFLGLGVTAGLTFYKYRDQGLEYGIVNFLHRAVFESYNSMKIIFKVFDTNNYLIGKSYYWDILSILPGKQITFQNYLTLHTSYSGKWTMALEPSLCGELYANFGWSSYLLYFMFGYISTSLTALTKRLILLKGSNLINYILYFILFVFMLRSVSVGFGGVIIFVIFTFIFFYIIRLLYHMIKSIS